MDSESSVLEKPKLNPIQRLGYSEGNVFGIPKTTQNEKNQDLFLFTPDQESENQQALVAKQIDAQIELQAQNV